MHKTGDICSLSDFRNNPRKHLKRVAKTRRPEVLTVNGKAAGVLMAPILFDEMAEKVRRWEVLEGIGRGLADLDAGRVAPARQVLRQIAGDLGLNDGK